jgi:hypothetical protein
MMRSIRFVTTILALTALTAAAGGAPSPAGASRSVRSQLAKAPITIRISLSRTRVVAGQSIKGTAVLTNTGSKAIVVQQCALDGWLAVGLANQTIRFTPGFLEVACPPSVVLEPGTTRFPVTVLTTYESCLQPAGESTTFVPKCFPPHHSSPSNPLPPLPAGVYSIKVVTMGLPRQSAVSESPVVTLLSKSH